MSKTDQDFIDLITPVIGEMVREWQAQGMVPHKPMCPCPACEMKRLDDYLTFKGPWTNAH